MLLKRGHISARRSLALALTALSLTTSFALMNTTALAAVINARGGVHENFDRIVFDWPRATPYTIRRDGPRVTIDFATEADIALRALPSAKLSRARGFQADDKKNGHTIVSFEVEPHAVLKDFTSGASLVLDVSGAAAAAKTETKDEKTVAEKAPTEKAASLKTAAEKPTPEKRAVAKPTDEKLAPVKPTQAQAAKEPTKEKAKESKETPLTVEKAAPPPAAPEPQISTPPAPIPTATPAPAAEPAVKAIVEKPHTYLFKPTAALNVGSSPEQILALDPHIEIGAAIFTRGGYGYILFDRKLTLDLASLTQGQSAPRVAVEAVDLENTNGLRFALPPDSDLHATRKGSLWQLTLNQGAGEDSSTSTISAQPDFALGSRLLLETIDPPEALRFTDPVIGDELMVLPLRQAFAFSAPRRFAELQVLPSAQGLVIKPLIEKLSIHKVTDGIEITAASGLRLSPTSDTGIVDNIAVKNKGGGAAGRNLFDLANWSGNKDETFSAIRQRLTQTIVDVPEAERNRARLDLARFYFAHSMGEEAMSLLKFLMQETPDLKNYTDFQALLGAVQVLEEHPLDGLGELTRPDLKFIPESQLWQAIAEVQLRNWQGAYEKFARTHNLLLTYPEPFYSKFSILAIEAALAADHDREASEWLAQLDMQAHAERINPGLSYLRGVLHSKAGRQQMAEELWKQVVASNDRLYQIRAQLALIDYGVATQSLTPAQAADRLETLRFSWRGDDLEIEVLHRLGLFYLEAKNVKAALNVLAQIIRLYPDSPQVSDIHKEMLDAFRSVFTDTKMASLSPLDALAMYQAYGDLMPAGEARIGVIRNLAERLVGIDLLDQASALLEGLVKDALQGEDKARTATRLAAIRLLDHKAEAALTALNYAPDTNLPAELTNERLMLRARILSELHKNDDALALLQNNTTTTGKLLRADINMRSQHLASGSTSLARSGRPSAQSW